MSNIKYRITNPNTFDKKDVCDVEFNNVSCIYDGLKLCAIEGTVTIRTLNGDKEIFGEHGIKAYKKEFGFEIWEEHTFDVVFEGGNESNSKGFEESKEYCIDWIETHLGTDHSYFDDYKGGWVCVINNDTGEEVFVKDIPNVVKATV